MKLVLIVVICISTFEGQNGLSIGTKLDGTKKTAMDYIEEANEKYSYLKKDGGKTFCRANMIVIVRKYTIVGMSYHANMQWCLNIS